MSTHRARWTLPLLAGALVVSSGCELFGGDPEAPDGVLDPPETTVVPRPSAATATALSTVPDLLRVEHLVEHPTRASLFLLLGAPEFEDPDIVLDAETGEHHRFDNCLGGSRDPLRTRPDGLVGLWDLRDDRLHVLYDPGGTTAVGYRICARDGVVEETTFVRPGGGLLTVDDVGFVAVSEDRFWFWPETMRSGTDRRWPSLLTSFQWETGAMEVAMEDLHFTLQPRAAFADGEDALLVVRFNDIDDRGELMPIERWTFAGGVPVGEEIGRIPSRWWPWPLHRDGEVLVFIEGVFWRDGGTVVPWASEPPLEHRFVRERDGEHGLFGLRTRVSLRTGELATTEVTRGGFTPTGHLYRIRPEPDGTRVLIESSDAIGDVLEEVVLPVGEEAAGAATFRYSDDGTCFWGTMTPYVRRAAPVVEEPDALSWWVADGTFLYAARCGEPLAPVVENGWYAALPSALPRRPADELGGVGAWSATGLFVVFRARYGDGRPRSPFEDPTITTHGFVPVGLALGDDGIETLFDYAAFVQLDEQRRPAYVMTLDRTLMRVRR